MEGEPYLARKARGVSVRRGVLRIGRVEEPEFRYAAQCKYLRTTLDSERRGELLNLCQHIVREGSECVGPFLEDSETDCGLWEYRPRLMPAMSRER
jgi:hypothetical protein